MYSNDDQVKKSVFKKVYNKMHNIKTTQKDQIGKIK